jgi:AcrR family transcriptional regulator
MQRPDEKKRQLIVATAARMFATLPYHKVRLDDIAAAAHIGKGTLYIYFDNKEDLYFSLIYDGFERLVDGLNAQLDETAPAAEPLPALDALRRIIDELVAFAFAHPHFFELMRSAGEVKRLAEGEWSRKRQEFIDLVGRTIRRGVREGTLHDPNPDMTAVCLGGMVRSIMLFGPRGLAQRQVADQVYRILVDGISRPAETRRVRGTTRGGVRRRQASSATVG